MTKTVFHPAGSRGHANHGWLNSYHTFSFAGYYNPERIQFGALRVLNDDEVAGGKGFGTHPHDNMEIVSIPLEGDLEHMDDIGNKAVINQGDVQVMSAGTGVFHSEYNKNSGKPVKFLQIWILPNKLNVKPRYDQITPDAEGRHNKLQQIISPDPNGEGTWIHQDAWFSMGNFDKDQETSYEIRKHGNGAYFFVLNGSFTVNGQQLGKRDGYGVWDTDKIGLTALENGSEVLIIDIPMGV